MVTQDQAQIRAEEIVEGDAFPSTSPSMIEQNHQKDEENQTEHERYSNSLKDDLDHKSRSNHSDSIDQLQVEQGVSGVAQAEAFTRLLRQKGSGRLLLWLLAICIGLSMFAYALDQGLTSEVFSIIASSNFSVHSEVAAVQIASKIITAVSKPFIGQLSNLTSRPTMYLTVLIFYCVGFAVAASAQTFTAYVVGICFTAFSKSGLDLLSDIIVADITPLQWRQFFTAALSSPFFITTYVGGFIADGLLPEHWRWGAGMFCIMMPALLGPVIVLLYYMQSKAKKIGLISFADTTSSRTAKGNGVEPIQKGDVVSHVKKAAIDIDAIGLLFLGFGFALILLPFSLANNSKGGWSNPSMIAMLVVGGVILLLFFPLYELYLAPVPLAPRRILSNRAFQIAILIDILTQFASFIEALYFSSYIYVIKDWTNFQWVAFTGTTTVGLCLWGLINGLLQRLTHRFKAQMVFGGICKVIAYAILNEPGPLGTIQNGRLIAAVVLLGFGGLTVGGARIASQAAVAHKDLTTAIFTVSLWSSFGSSCGAAVAATIWQRKMPKNLALELPTLSAAEIKKYYGSVKIVHQLPIDSPTRQGVIRAFQRTNGILFTTAACLAVIPLILSLFVPNYWLGEQHNLVQNRDLDGRPVRVILRRPNEGESKKVEEMTGWQKVKHYVTKCWDA